MRKIVVMFLETIWKMYIYLIEIIYLIISRKIYVLVINFSKIRIKNKII